jgi:hypothetical protein
MTIRLAVIISISSGLTLAACAQPTREGVLSMDVAEHVISLERSALDSWIRAMRGVTLPFTEPRYDATPQGST